MNTLADLIKAALNALGQDLPVDIDNFLGDAGQQAANAVAQKMYLQDPSRYASDPTSDPTAVGQGGQTNTQLLAQDSFLEFRHYLRDGNGSYPGAPGIPALQTGADFIYGDGQYRTQIHNWCNAAASSVLANPPAQTSATTA